MKFTAALLALAAAIAAPLASAAPDCSTLAKNYVLGNLTVSNTIKRTSVKGGARITQTIKITNNGASDAADIGVATLYNADNTFVRGNAKMPRSKAVALNAATSPADLVSSGSTKITIPAGKTLKATIFYKAKACPATSPKEYDFGEAAAFIVGDTNGIFRCNKDADAVTVRIKTCFSLNDP
jgi:hypothetical protein